MSILAIDSVRRREAVPPVEMISTPISRSRRANGTMPFLSETEIRARVIFIEAEGKQVLEDRLLFPVDAHFSRGCGRCLSAGGGRSRHNRPSLEFRHL